jgi:thioredoxin reductase
LKEIKRYLFMLNRMNIESIKDYYKYIIIGAGPAGLQSAYYLQNVYPQDYLMIEMNSEEGSFFKSYPRLKKLISINKSQTYSFEDNAYDSMRYDWNSLLTTKNIRLSNITKDFYPNTEDLLDYFKLYSKEHHLKIWFNTQILNIYKNPTSECFILHCLNKNYAEEIVIHCEYLIVSTGLKEKAIPLDIIQLSNEINAEVESYGSFKIDLEYYKGKNIVIVGTGNAAFETANYLNNVAMSIALIGPTKLAWKTHYPGHLRSVNMGFIDTLYLKMGNIMYLDKYDTLQAIKLQTNFLKYCNAKVDIIIYCGGFECNLPLFDKSIYPDIDSKKYPILTPWYESINIPKLYITGTLSHGYDYKKGTSSFIHGFRYNIEFLMRYIHNDILPLKLDSKEALKTHILKRLNYCSCLHHRHGYYSDYSIITSTDIFYYEKIHNPFIEYLNDDINIKYVNAIKLQIGFEYGKEDFSWNLKQPGGFNQPDIVIPFRDTISKFLHPVFDITFRNGKKKKYHVGESPTGQFFHPIHSEYIYAIIDLSYTNHTLEDQCDFEKKILDLYYLL